MTGPGSALLLPRLEATEAAGALLAEMKAPRIVYLEGDLGVGKTTWVRGLLRRLGHEGAVRSPTYTLVEPYVLGGREVLHFDLYRLGDPEELEYLGVREDFGGQALWLVEWPERGQGWLPAADLVMRLAHRPDAAEGRELNLEGPLAATYREALLERGVVADA